METYWLPLIAVVHEPASLDGPPIMESLFQSIQDEARHAPSGSPASRRSGGHRCR